MTLDDKPQFVCLLLKMAKSYRQPFGEENLNKYWRLLSRFTLAEIDFAIAKHLATPKVGTFMPQPSDIVCVLEGTHEFRALKAWTKITQAMKVVGAYNSIVFDDPLIHLAISDLGGWIHLCGCRTKDLEFKAHDFIKLYQGYLLKQLTHYPSHLIGMTEHQNRMHGYAIAPPHLYGDEMLAPLTFQNGLIPNIFSRQQRGLGLSQWLEKFKTETKPILAMEDHHDNKK